MTVEKSSYSSMDKKIPLAYQSWSRLKRKVMGLSIHWEEGFNVTAFKLNLVFISLRVTRMWYK